jgi:DNA-binding NarL/FixJ family response regulator
MNDIRVLIADDMPQVRKDLRTVLLLAGEASGTPIDVLGEAGNGLQAIQKAIDLQPDVILMDLEMPGMDGFMATQEIKAACPATRVLVLTVHGDPQDRSLAFQAGADSFLVKGAPVADIIAEIKRFIEERKRD